MAKEEKGYWFSTENGTHIHAEEGESKVEAMEKKFKSFKKKKGLTEVDPNKIEHKKDKYLNDPKYQKFLADEQGGEHEKVSVEDKKTLTEVQPFNEKQFDEDAKKLGYKYSLFFEDSYKNYLANNNLNHSVDNLKTFLENMGKSKAKKKETTIDPKQMDNEYRDFVEYWSDFGTKNKLGDEEYYDVVSSMSWLSNKDAFDNDYNKKTSGFFFNKLNERLKNVEDNEIVSKIKNTSIYKNAESKLK